MRKLVLTLIGLDRPGLVETVAGTVGQFGGNWLDSRMAHLAGKFAGILSLEVPEDKVDDLTNALQRLESRGLKVVVEAAQGPAEAKSVRQLDLDLVGQDRPGIVREISQLLASRGANVEELTTDRTSAPMSGEPLFRARARVQVGADVDVSDLRAGLERIANDLMVEIRFVDSGR